MTVATGSNAGQGICQVNINININLIVEPVVPAPAVIVGNLGTSVIAIIPLPFIGIFPIIWTATPAAGCPGVAGG